MNDVINRFSLPLFLFHSTGMALSKAVGYAIWQNRQERPNPTLWWWVQRPVAFIGPLLFTLPVIYLFGRQWVKRSPQPSTNVST